MPSPKIYRGHAAKCTQVAETLPPGKQREMFLDMARQWIAHAEKVESSEASVDERNLEDEHHRFGSRIHAPTIEIALRA